MMKRVTPRTRSSTTAKLAALAAVIAMTLAPITGLGAADPVEDVQDALHDAEWEARREAAHGIQDAQGTVQDTRQVACQEEDLEEAFCGVTQAWAAQYDGSTSADDARASAVSPDGSTLYVAGMSRGAGTNYDYATVAYDTITGGEAWVARYDGTGSGYDLLNDIAVSPDGTRVFVTGWSTGDGTRGDATTVAYNALTGDALWSARYDGPASSHDAGSSIAVSPDGTRVHVTGYGIGAANNDDFVTITYDAASGNELWLTRYDGPANDYDRAKEVHVSPDGTFVYVGGDSSGIGSSIDYTVVAYDAETGDEAWVGRYDGPLSGPDGIYGMGVTPDGSTVIVTGASQGPRFDYDFTTVAFNTDTGSQAWFSRYDGVAGLYDIARSLAVSPDGSTVYVSGPSISPTWAMEYVTVAYNVATGLESWAAVHNDGNSATPRAMGVSPDGRTVYVTGQSYGRDTGLDMMTVSYDATTGLEMWVSKYASDGRGHDIGSTLSVNPLGTAVYVAGRTPGEGWDRSDFGTVAYDVLANPASLLPE